MRRWLWISCRVYERSVSRCNEIHEWKRSMKNRELAKTRSESTRWHLEKGKRESNRDAIILVPSHSQSGRHFSARESRLAWIDHLAIWKPNASPQPQRRKKHPSGHLDSSSQFRSLIAQRNTNLALGHLENRQTKDQSVEQRSMSCSLS